jgi:hypothetical protein
VFNLLFPQFLNQLLPQKGMAVLTGQLVECHLAEGMQTTFIDKNVLTRL